ncbi:MAG: TlpA family protein disulfide reductase, partial [Muricauda sp.]|nr:TlpA family protein disulfide reductase [Allomuricauda sp.]
MRCCMLLILLYCFTGNAQKVIQYKLKGTNQVLQKDQVDSLSAIYGGQMDYTFKNSKEGMDVIIDIDGLKTLHSKGQEDGGGITKLTKPEINRVQYTDLDGRKISKEEFDTKFDSGRYIKKYVIEEKGSGALDLTWSLEPRASSTQNPLLQDFKNLKNTKFPVFKLYDMQGKPVNHSSLEGKLTIMNFWFIGCKPCELEIPQLNRVVHHFKDSREVQFLAPAWNKDMDQMARFLAKKNFDYKVLMDADILIQELKIGGYPTHLVIDRNGIIKEMIIGAKDNIDSLLIAAINNNLE